MMLSLARGVLNDVPGVAALFVCALLMMPALPTSLYVGGLVGGMLAGWRCTADVATDAAIIDEPV